MTDEERGATANDRDDVPSPELRRMIDEVRTSAPQLDWERLEARLFDADGNVHEHSGVQRLSPAPRESVRRPGTRWAAVSAGLALAAAFALAILSPARPVENGVAGGKPQPVATPSIARAPLLAEDGQPVSVGQRVTASSGAWLRSAGRISIHLEPGTIATVLDIGERVHLVLESGAVAADVVPVAGGEPFAVDVAGQRVAVHGTHLRVALLGQAVQVAVSEGSAVVGLPRGPGRTEGTIVPAGVVGRFDSATAPGALRTDAALATRLVEDSLVSAPKPASTSVVAQAPHAPTHPMAVPPAAKPAPEPVLTAPVIEPTPPKPVAPGLSAEQLSEPLSKLGPSLQTCARKTKAGVVFVNEQDLTLEISPAGKATLVTAEPGLDTADRGCWGLVVSALSFPKAEGSTTVKRHVVVGSN